MSHQYGGPPAGEPQWNDPRQHTPWHNQPEAVYGPPPGPTAAAAPTGTKPKRRWLWPAVTGVAALAFGVAIGSSGGSEAAESTPATDRETVAEVPAACLDALVEADELLRISGEFATIASDYPLMVVEAAEAGVNYDVAAIEDLTARMEASTADIDRLTGRVSESSYADDAAGCRAASEATK